MNQETPGQFPQQQPTFSGTGEGGMPDPTRVDPSQPQQYWDQNLGQWVIPATASAPAMQWDQTAGQWMPVASMQQPHAVGAAPKQPGSLVSLVIAIVIAVLGGGIILGSTQNWASFSLGVHMSEMIVKIAPQIMKQQGIDPNSALGKTTLEEAKKQAKAEFPEKCEWEFTKTAFSADEKSTGGEKCNLGDKGNNDEVNKAFSEVDNKNIEKADFLPWSTKVSGGLLIALGVLLLAVALARLKFANKPLAFVLVGSSLLATILAALEIARTISITSAMEKEVHGVFLKGMEAAANLTGIDFSLEDVVVADSGVSWGLMLISICAVLALAASIGSIFMSTKKS